MDVEKVARLPACDVLLHYLAQSMADAIAAFRSVLDQIIFCITKSIDTGGITRHEARFIY